MFNLCLTIKHFTKSNIHELIKLMHRRVCQNRNLFVHSRSSPTHLNAWLDHTNTSIDSQKLLAMIIEGAFVQERKKESNKKHEVNVVYCYSRFISVVLQLIRDLFCCLSWFCVKRFKFKCSSLSLIAAVLETCLPANIKLSTECFHWLDM